MRRYARTLILIILIVAVSGLSLGFQTVKLGDFERGANNLLGLTLGLDLQGGIQLVIGVDTKGAIDTKLARIGIELKEWGKEQKIPIKNTPNLFRLPPR